MIVFGIFTLAHVFFFLYLRTKWLSIGEVHKSDASNVGVTVLVPVRNESGLIRRLLVSLKEQNYKQDLIEVLVIDDHSDDQTVIEAQKCIREFNLTGKVLILPDDQKGKKAASTLGVSRASHDYILCTDADCRLPEDWVALHTKSLTNGCKMVTGPVRIEAGSIFEQFQAVEFSALIAYGGVSLSEGFPGMCNGANMSYHRQAFQEVGGYAGNDHIPTGDDEFLLQKINRSYPGKVTFLKSALATVTTMAKQSPEELWAQRIRWTSKWRFHKSRFIHVTAVLVFLDFLIGALMIPICVVTLSPFILSMILSRWISEWLFLRKTASFFGVRGDLFLLAGLSSIYPFYVLFLGFASIFGKYSWKGRRY